MKRIIMPFLILLMLFVSCKKEVVEAPDRLIEKDKMVAIMYDFSLLGAMRSQNPVFLDSFKDNPNEYIYKKYKIDSAQFAQSNIYYASDLKEYKKMYEQVKSRLDNTKKTTEALIKAENVKSEKSLSKSEKDSVAKVKLLTAKLLDSIKRHKRKSRLGF